MYTGGFCSLEAPPPVLPEFADIKPHATTQQQATTGGWGGQPPAVDAEAAANN